jgi:RNA polymerase sigma factor (sigma-70 family)
MPLGEDGKADRVTDDEAPGDAALVAFCEREHSRLVGSLSLYLNDSMLAEELAHETLIRVMDAWPRVSAMPAPGAYAHRVAMNLANSWFRRRAAERRAVRRLEDRHMDDCSDLADVLAVRAAVAGLPERQRRSIVLRYYLGYPLEVTAATLGVSEQAAASLCYRAMENLRGRLRDGTRMQESPDAR